MNIKEIVEGMTAPQVAQVIKDNFNEVDKDKANKTDLNKSISELGSKVGIVTLKPSDDYHYSTWASVNLVPEMLYRLDVKNGQVVDIGILGEDGQTLGKFDAEGEFIPSVNVDTGNYLLFKVYGHGIQLRVRFNAAYGLAEISTNNNLYDLILQVDSENKKSILETNEIVDDVKNKLYSFKQFTSITAWKNHEYTLEPNKVYEIVNLGNGDVSYLYGVSEAGEVFNLIGFSALTERGSSCLVSVNKKAVELRSFSNAHSVFSVQESIDYKVKAEAIDSNKKRLDELQQRISYDLIWPSYKSAELLQGVTYRITNNSDAGITNLEIKGVSSTGKMTSYAIIPKVVTSLEKGESIYYTSPINVTDARCYPSANITIEPVDVNITDKVIRGEATDGYAVKDTTKHIVIVSKTGGSNHFPTIAEAYASITDSAYNNQYEVIVYPGKYNEINLMPPPFTHTHGLAPNSVVVSSEGCGDSTLPVFDQQDGSSKLSNMTIESHNGYCVHFDVLLSGKTIVNDNLHLRKMGTPSGAWHLIGGGTFLYGCSLIWNNCVFESKQLADVSCHTNSSAEAYDCAFNTRFVLNACKFINAVPQIGSVGGFGICVCELNNCELPIGAKGLGSWLTHYRVLPDANLYLYKTNEWQVVGHGNKNLSMWQMLQGKTIQMKSDKPIAISGSAAPIIFGNNPTYNNIKTSRLDCYVRSEYYIDDTQAGHDYADISKRKDVYQLWKRLGDCSTINKVLIVEVGGVKKTYTFTDNYESTKPSQNIIIAEMQSVLTNVTIEHISDSGYGYDNVNTSDCLYIKVASNDIIKGEPITVDGYRADDTTPSYMFVGFATEDKPIGEYVKVWTSSFKFDYDVSDGEYGFDESGRLTSDATKKIGFVRNGIFYNPSK